MPADPIRQRFFNAEQMAVLLNVKKKTVKNWAVGAEAGSLFAPCRRGQWHQEQARLIEAVHIGAATEDEAQALWKLFKCDFLSRKEGR